MTRKDRRSHLFMIWSSMKRRCENPNMQNYQHYGARGIKVCAEWHSFFKFEEWAKTHGYVDGLTIDRIDNNGNYEPDNCQWISGGDNARNALETIISVDGVEGNVRAWAKLLDCSPSVISYHMNGRGSPVEKFIKKRANGKTVRFKPRATRMEQRLSKSPDLEVTA